MLESFVFQILEDRKTRNRLFSRQSIALSPAALSALQTRQLSNNWFTYFFDRHPSVRRVHVSNRVLSLERAMAITPHARDTLFEFRKDALLRTGILDPATGLVDTSRIANCDECPQNIDGVARGNNVPIRLGKTRITIAC